MATVQGWSGPLPPPAALQAFEAVAPGSAQAIIAEFQTEAAHRRDLERREANLIVADNFVGRVTALLFAAGGFAVAAYGISQGAEWAASIIGGGMIVGGMTVLIKGRNDK